ncbi:hypothetical protein Clacol_004121 [Clathrus columnatus]|uniref:HIRAN domain-containing protein n=1 Tax=Clathrus columnatus TaxID=1419009 RepID=A0AAV5A8P8_9AGAM|nr:hypothetical protein Clacol_004121 [Clathrus columnatus]
MTSTSVYFSKPLFFASDSENEEETKSMHVDPPNEVEASNAEYATTVDTKKRLFFASSDDDDDTTPPDIDTILERRLKEAPSYLASSPRPRESSVTSIRSSSPVVKKRKITPPVKKLIPSNPSNYTRPANDTKKNTINSGSESISKVVGFEFMYVGSFLVPNAWSTCKGRGWVKSGETIEICRNDEENHKASSNKPVKAAATGQLKLTSMLKAKDKVPKPVKKGKEDNVIRFTNSRGFEIGRLPQNIATWISKLLDQSQDS